MSDKIDIFILDKTNNIIQELNVIKPKSYTELLFFLNNKIKNIPKYFNVSYLSSDNNKKIINNNEEYKLSKDIFFVQEIEQNDLQKNVFESSFSIIYNNLSESKRDILDEKYNCFICTESIKNEKPLFCYNCQKIFHNKCLEDWDKKRRIQNEQLTCPNCRNELSLEQWRQKLDFKDNKNNEVKIMNELNIKENEIKQLYEQNNEKNKLIKEYSKYIFKISDIFKDLINILKEINLIIKKKDENKKLSDLIRKINFDYINPPINDISEIILKQLNIIKEYIKSKEKEKENIYDIYKSNEVLNDKNSKFNQIDNNENKNGILNYNTNSFNNINISQNENKNDKLISNYYSNYFYNNKDLLKEGNKNEKLISNKNKDSYNKNKPITIENNIYNFIKYDDREKNLSFGQDLKKEKPLFDKLKTHNIERANLIKNRYKNQNMDNF